MRIHMALFEKKLSIFGSMLVVAIVGLVFFSVHTQNQAIGNAEEFLGLIGGGKYQEAYDSASDEFQEIVTVAQIEKLIGQIPEIQVDTVKWNSKEIQSYENGTKDALLLGTVMTADDRIEIKLHMRKIKSGEWKVLGVFFPGMDWSQTDFLENANDVETPSIEERFALAQQMMDLLHESIERDEFTPLYNFMVEPVKATSSPNSFKNTFTHFVETNPSFLSVEETYRFEVDEDVERGENGVLMMTGRYVSDSLVFHIRMDFEYEKGAWRGLYVRVEQPRAVIQE